MPDREHDRENECEDLRQVDDGAEELEAVLRRREREHPVEGPACRCPPRHQPEQDQASASVPIILTSGSRGAKAGPSTTPYRKVTAPPNATQARYASQCGRLVWLIIQYAIRAPAAPIGAEGEIEHPGGLIEHDDPDSRQCVRTAERQAEHDVRLEELPIDAEHRERNDAIHQASGAL